MVKRVQTQPAYILHRRPYSESSLLLEAFSLEHGRVAMIARGARAPKSRWHALLQPFKPLLLSWSARGELGSLTAAESPSNSGGLQQLGLYCGLYVNELVMRLLARNDAHVDLFQMYAICLDKLKQDQALHQTLRWFELHLLTELGLGLQLDREAGSGEPLRPDATYTYDAISGPVLAAHAGSADSYTGAMLLALASEDFSRAKFRTPMKQLLQSVLNYHLGDKPLRSRELLRSLGPRSDNHGMR